MDCNRTKKVDTAAVPHISFGQGLKLFYFQKEETFAGIYGTRRKKLLTKGEWRSITLKTKDNFLSFERETFWNRDM